MDNKLRGVFSNEGSGDVVQALETVSVENVVEFGIQIGTILHDFEQHILVEMLAIIKNYSVGRVINEVGSQKLVALHMRLRQSKQIRALLDEVSESLASADNIDDELLPKIAVIEKMVGELSADDLQGNVVKGSDVDLNRKEVGGFVRKEVGKDLA